MDLVRQLFDAVNRSDAVAVAACYHPACILEHVFTDDAGVYEGHARVRERWAREFQDYAGACAGQRRIEVRTISGLETGWGWARADWHTVLTSRDGRERRERGHSHFWVEDGLIRRHRSVRREDDAPVDAAPPAPDAVERSSARQYPTRPIVGVGAVILTGDRQVVLVKRRYEPLAGQWSLPGGTLDVGETLEAGTAREIHEETGLIVDVGPVVEVFDRILVDEAGRVRYHFVLIDYLCRPREGKLLAGSDVAEVALVDAGAVGPFRLSEKAQSVIRRALERGAAAW
jgi:8-oxo-dGTP diphosphatase